jgi:hypothetical protein
MKLVVAGNSDGTSVKESEEGISIIPNPASDYITVDVTFLRMQESEIKIYNIFGECVLSTPSSLRDATPQEGNFKIDISSLPAGVYFVKRGNDKPMKFVIVR